MPLSSAKPVVQYASGLIETNAHHGKMSSILSQVSLLKSLDVIGDAPHHAVLGNRVKYAPVPPSRRAALPEQERANKAVRSSEKCWRQLHALLASPHRPLGAIAA
jgi:hypothetical protein